MLFTRRRPSALLVVALALAAACRTAPPPDPRLERARALSRVESWAEAAALWSDIYFASGGEDVEAGLAAADAMIADERFQNARVVLVDVTRRAPDRAGVFERLGRVHEDLGALDDARANYRAAVELDPTNAFAWQRLGVMLDGPGEFGEGLAALERSVALDPGDARTRILLGLRLLRSGDRDRALPQLEDSLGSRFATDRERLEAVALLGPVPAAVDWMRPIVQRDPHNGEAQRFLGEALIASGRLDSGLAALEAAARSDPGDIDLLLALVRGLDLAGNTVRARAVLEHAAGLDLTPNERAAVEAAGRLVGAPDEGP